MSAGKVCPQCGTEYELDQRFCPKDGSGLRSAGGAKDLVGQLIAERYHVMKKLGEGGMGQVYLAEHVKMGRRSAVKVMHQAMNSDADAVSRFNREASNAARISHPNVCAIYDFGETADGLIYLAMEFIEGQPLTDVVEQSGALAPARAGEIVRQVAAALDVAHDFGIVHRDLKPDNIMVTRTRDGADLVKVVDFGIAKAANNEAQKVTKTGLVVGTPEYMSPEQLAGDKLDGRSDVYSLGLVAYNCLTGRLPFAAETAQETMILRLTDDPAPLAQAKPEVPWPPELQEVMDRVLARDARDRYATAGEFAKDFVRQIGRMPQTQVMEAGTQVVGAVKAAAGGATAQVPSTRIASAAEQRRGGATAAMPAAPVAPAAPAPSGKSPALLIGAAVAVAVLGGGGYALLRPKSPEAPTPSAIPPVATARPAAQPATSPAGGTTPPVPAPAAPAATLPAGRPSGGASRGGSTAPGEDPTGTLDRIERAVVEADAAADAAKAESLLRQLERLSFSGGAETRRNFLRANALYVMKDDGRACGILKDISPRAKAAGLTPNVQALSEAAKCP